MLQVSSVTLNQVGTLAFGPGVSRQIADDMAARQLRSALLVSAPPIRAHTERVAEAIRAKGIAATIWDDCDNEPAVADFDRVMEVARSCGIDAVVGIGGGSSMDLAKLVAALLDGRQAISEVSGVGLLKGRACWLACIPTTAGTGSEVSPIAILLDESDLLKKGVVSPHLVPDAAYVDPELMLSVPAEVTAATGLDALTHCIEAYANRFAHPVVDTYALEGVRLIGRSLLRAVQHGDDLEARGDMARGSLYGGLCLGPVNTAAVHALAYPLGGEFHIAHGISNAMLLPHVLTFNLPAASDRYADIALALGAKPGADAAATARRGLELIEQLCRDCAIPMRLREHNVPSDAIERMADGAMTVTRLLRNNPREVARADAVRIYEAAY